MPGWPRRSEGFDQGLSERQITDLIHRLSSREQGRSHLSAGTLFRWLENSTRHGQAGLVDARIVVHQDDENRTAFIEELKTQYLLPRAGARWR